MICPIMSKPHALPVTDPKYATEGGMIAQNHRRGWIDCQENNCALWSLRIDTEGCAFKMIVARLGNDRIYEHRYFLWQNAD